MLINGDKIVSATARSGGVVSAPSGIGGALLNLRLGGKHYEIPAVALPYLGRGLDPSLFDLNSLIGNEASGRLLVRVGFQGRPPALPGVRVTHAASGLEDGYLTASSARLFGVALTRQFRVDHARGHYGSDGLFGHEVVVSLAGVMPHQVAKPAFVMDTLAVTGINTAGKPDEGDVVSVFNADNSNRFADPVESFNDFFHGSAKFSVPVGHYWAVGMFFDLPPHPALRLVVLPQFTVARTTSVRVDERTATSEITMATPRRAVAQSLSIELRRSSPAGFALPYSAAVQGLPLWTNTTSKRPTVGGLQTFTDGLLTSPSGKATPYEYDLAFAGPSGIVPPQHFVVRAANTARVDARYYSAVSMTGQFGRAGLFPAQLRDGFVFVNSFPLKLPQRRIEYTSVGTGLLWKAVLTTNAGDFLQNDGFRQYHARQRAREDWNRYPLHVGVNADLLGAANPFVLPPSAGRAGDTLSIDMTPFSDNLPGHAGNGYAFDIGGARISGGFEIDQNGKKIAAAKVVEPALPDLLIPAVRLSARPSVIRLVLTAARNGRQYPLSTSSQTIWTWHSSHEAGTTLRAGWTCASTFLSGVLSHDCAAEPLLTLQYAVGGLALDGSAAAGPQVLDVSVGHLQLAHAAKITGATVAASFDDGKTWHPASVGRRQGRGDFRAVFTAPPPGSGKAWPYRTADNRDGCGRRGDRGNHHPRLQDRALSRAEGASP